MKNLLNEENTLKLKQRESVLKYFNAIKTSYNTKNLYLSDTEARAQIYFNRNTRCSIFHDHFVLSGFGIVNAPDAALSYVSGCGNEGHIVLKSLSDFVNALATYENILPLN
jgi:hypothetical protein